MSGMFGLNTEICHYTENEIFYLKISFHFLSMKLKDLFAFTKISLVEVLYFHTDDSKDPYRFSSNTGNYGVGKSLFKVNNRNITFMC